MVEQTVVTAGMLRRSLLATIPAANTDETIPGICAVHLHASRNLLLATATDRYIAAHARCEASGADLAETVIRVADAKLVISWLRTLRPEVEVGLSCDKDSLVVSTGRFTMRFDAAELDQWPRKSMASVFSGTSRAKDTREPNPPGRLDLGQQRLASLNRILAATPKGSTTRWRVGAGWGPVLVDVGDWLLVAVMPMKIRLDDQHVMFGLPEPELAPTPRRSRKAPVAKATATPRRKAS